ncbi:hypothetical protein PM082_009640 [Marasmius tenuissimus]|nr:hypothetical protein PM082_009640 [Marasmius tenuissimus]
MSSTATIEELEFAEEVFRLGIVPSMAVTAVHLFLYGLHVLLFRDVLVVIRRRQRQKLHGHRLLQFSLITLFSLSSIGVPAGLATDFLAVRKAYYHAIAGIEYNPVNTERALSILTVLRVIVLLLMGLVIEGLLIFRCFVICGWTKKTYGWVLMAVCLVLNVSAGSLFCIGDELSRLGYLICIGCHVLVDMTLATIIVVKILWTSRLTSRIAGISTIKRRLRIIVVSVVESCLLYVLGWITYIAVLFTVGDVAGSVLIQIAGIAPTLLIVRANTSDHAEKLIEGALHLGSTPLTASAKECTAMDAVKRRDSTV